MNAINVVENVVGIETSEGSCATSIPGYIDGVSSSWTVVIDFEFIVVRVAVELSPNDVVETVDDATVFA